MSFIRLIEGRAAFLSYRSRVPVPLRSDARFRPGPRGHRRRGSGTVRPGPGESPALSQCRAIWVVPLFLPASVAGKCAEPARAIAVYKST